MKRTTCVILGVASLGLGAFLFRSTLLLFIFPPTFESRAKVLAQVSIPKATNWSVESDAQLFQSKEILSQVITNLALARRWGEKYKQGTLEFDATYAMLRRQIDIQRLSNGHIIEVRATSEDPGEAASIANAIVETTLSENAKIVIPVDRPGTARTTNRSPSNLTIVGHASPSPHPVRPSRFQKTEFAIGGFAAVIVGVVLLILAWIIPKRSGPPPLQS